MKFSTQAQVLHKTLLRACIGNPCAPVILMLSALVWTPTPAGGTPGENALNILNQFMAESAAKTPAYRADLQRSFDPAHMADGRLKGFSSLIGPFSYRPKKYAELTQAERVELLRDGRFHHYLLIKGRPFTIDPKDMLTPEPLEVKLDLP